MDRQISIYHSEVDVHEVSSILEGQLHDLPPIPSHIVRVFVSSTFSDTIEERNALMEQVYPKLKDVCRDQYGVEFQAIDLRWGIRDESQDDHTIIDFCLREIENCQKSSIGPSFVAFLGQKYGYRPFPPNINADEFSLIRDALVHAGKDVSLLDKWFKKDENVIPPVCNLQPISSLLSHYKDEEDSEARKADHAAWQHTFTTLQQLLRDGVLLCVEHKTLPNREKSKYFVSVTEYEIEHGMMKLSDPASQCLVFTRTITNLTDHLRCCSPHAAKFIDLLPDGTTVDAPAQSLLRRLKLMKVPHVIRDPRNMSSFRIDWSDGSTPTGSRSVSVSVSNGGGTCSRENGDGGRPAGRGNGADPPSPNCASKTDSGAARPSGKGGGGGDGGGGAAGRRHSGEKGGAVGRGHSGEKGGVSKTNSFEKANVVGRANSAEAQSALKRGNSEDHVRKPTANQAYLAEFCETFYNKMLSLVARCVSARRHVVTDQYVLEILQHLSVCRARREGFRGREALIARIRRYVTRARRPGGGAGGVGGALAGVARDQPLVVYGQSGSGKTSVLAKAACMVHGWFAPPTRPVLVVRFLGTTARSASLRLILGCICWQIGSIYGRDVSTLPLDCPGLVARFHELLHCATEERPLVILLDSLDQLAPTYQAHGLAWLPRVLPPSVRLVLSMLPRDHGLLDTLRGHHGCVGVVTERANFAKVEPLGSELGSKLVEEWLAGAGRRLTPAQTAVVNDALVRCSLPLYARLCFEQACRWHSYTPPEQTQLQDCVTGILNTLFERVERHYGATFVRHALSYLTGTKNGVSEAELDDLLSLDDDVLNDVFIHWLPPVRRIPPLLWPRLHNELASYIVQREANGTIVFYWYHRQFIEVARFRYLSHLPYRLFIHSSLAHYFLGTWGGGRRKPFTYTSVQVRQLGLPRAASDADRKVPLQPLQFCCSGAAGGRKVRYNLRKLSELPYHLVCSRRLNDINREVLFNYQWLHAKITSMSLHDVLSDFRLVTSSLPDTAASRSALEETQLLASTLRLCGSYVDRNPDTLAFDLAGRLLPYYDHCPNIRGLLQQCDTVALRHTSVVPVFPCFEATKGMLQYILEEHQKIVYDLIFSRCTGELISVSLDGTIAFWDLSSGERTRTIDLGGERLGQHTRLLQSGDGRLLMCDSCESHTPVYVFDTRTATLLHKIGRRTPNQRRVFAVGNLLVRQKQILDVRSGVTLCSLDDLVGDTRRYAPCAVTPDELHVLVGEEAHTQMFAMKTATVVARFAAAHMPCVFVITADSSRAYVGYTHDCLFKVFDLDTRSPHFGTVTAEFSPQGTFSGVQVSEDVPFGCELAEIAISPFDDNVVLLNVKRCHLIRLDVTTLAARLFDTTAAIANGGGAGVAAAAVSIYIDGATFSYDGSFVLAGVERHLHIWNAATGRLLKKINQHSTSRFPFAVSHNKNCVATGSAINTAIKVWNFDAIDREGEAAASCPGGVVNGVGAAAAAVAAGGCVTRMLAGSEAEDGPGFRVYDNAVEVMAGCPADLCLYVQHYVGLASASGYRFFDSFGIDVWNLSTGQCRPYLPFAQYGKLLLMEVSRDGRKMALLLGVRSDHFLVVIDMITNRVLASLLHKDAKAFVIGDAWQFAVTTVEAGVTTAAGQTATRVAEMRLWNVKSEAEVESFTHATCPVFTADGRCLLYVQRRALVVVYCLRTFSRRHAVPCVADRLQSLPKRTDVVMATMFGGVGGEDAGPDDPPYSQVKLIEYASSSGKIVSRISYVAPSGILDVSKDGQVAIDGYLQVYDLRCGVILNDLAGAAAGGGGARREYDLVRLTWDGRYAVWVDGLSVVVRGVMDGRTLASVSTHERPTALTLLHYGYLLAVGREDGHVLIMRLLPDGPPYVNIRPPSDLAARTRCVLGAHACDDDAVAGMALEWQVRPRPRADATLAAASDDVCAQLTRQAKVPVAIIKTWSESDLKAASAAVRGTIPPRRRLSSPLLFIRRSRENSPRQSPLGSPKNSPKLRVKAKSIHPANGTLPPAAAAPTAHHDTATSAFSALQRSGNLLMAFAEVGSTLRLTRTPPVAPPRGTLQRMFDSDGEMKSAVAAAAAAAEKRTRSGATQRQRTSSGTKL